MTPRPAPEDRNVARPSSDGPTSCATKGCGVLVWLLVALGVPALIAAWVVSLASGSYQMDALGPAMNVFLVWLVVGGWLARHHSGSRGVWFTLHSTENDAPDGSSFEEDFDQASVRVTNEVEGALDLALPGRWEAWEDNQFPPPLQRCIDTFGRSRGAGASSATWFLEGEVSDVEVAELDRLLRSPQTDFRVERRGERFQEWDSERRFVIYLEQGADGWRLDAYLPCLRLR